MALECKGKVALVTGGAAGIGRATSLAFAREGARVMVADVTDEEGQAVVRECREAGGEAEYIHCDVSASRDIRRMVEATVEKFGALDYAFNNAGIEGPQALLGDYSDDGWDKVMAINLTGVWNCMKYELQHMSRQGSGVIINNSSVGGLVGFANVGPYVASKHGVIGLTRTAALEYAPQGIRVNAVCPGIIRTAMIERVEKEKPEMIRAISDAHPMKRIGTPDEVAEVVLWLCAGAHFVTGHAMPIDGGYVAQ